MRDRRLQVLLGLGCSSAVLYLLNLPQTVVFPRSEPFVGRLLEVSGRLTMALVPVLWSPPRIAVLLALPVLIWLAYGLALWVAARIEEKDVKNARRVILGCFLAVTALLYLTPGQNSTDVFYYAYLGRLGAVYGQLNPYAPNASEHSEDFFRKAYPPFETTIHAHIIYQPGLQLPLEAIVALAGPDPLREILAIKLVLSALLIASVFKLDALVSRYGPRHHLLSLVLVAWNPLVLWELAGEGHNESWLMFLALSALGAWLDRRHLACANWLCLALWTKFTTGPLLGFYMLTLVRDKAWKELGQAVGVLAAWSVGIVLLGGRETLEIVELNGIFVSCWPLVMAYWLTQVPGWHAPDLTDLAPTVRTVLALVWGLAFLYQTQKPGDLRTGIARLGGLHLCLYMFVASILTQWYIPVCLVMLSLVPDAPLVPAALLFCFCLESLHVLSFAWSVRDAADYLRHLSAVFALPVLACGYALASSLRPRRPGGSEKMPMLQGEDDVGGQPGL